MRSSSFVKLWMLVLFVVGSCGLVQAQTTAFTYQGKLMDGGAPASGTYQMQFSLHSAVSGEGNQIGATITIDSVSVTNGPFTVELNFTAPNAFDGSARWLQISVKKAADPSFVSLNPRQPISSTPYAVRTLSAASAEMATNATQLGGVAASQYVLTSDTRLSDARPASSVNFDTASLSGTVPPARLPSLAGDVTGPPNATVLSSVGGQSASNVAAATTTTNAATSANTANTIIKRDAGGNFSAGTITASLNGNATSATTAHNVSGIVAIANGGTGNSTQNFVDLSTNQTVGGNKTFTGTLSGNGSGLTNLNGINLDDGTVSTNKLADGSVTQAKLAFGAANKYDSKLLGMLRWDLLPTPQITNVGSNPRALAFDGTFVYVANSSSNNVTRIRASTGVVEGGPIPVGSGPDALAYDGTFIYVANSLSNNVTRIRASTGVVEGGPIPVGTDPSALAYDGTFMYVANSGSNTVMRIRASTGVVEGDPISVLTPRALAFDGTFIDVASDGDEAKKVLRIRASTGVVEGFGIGVSSSPVALAYDGTFIYVVQYFSNNVARIRASNGAHEGIIPVGAAPVSIAFDGTFMYVASSSGSNNTAAKIRVTSGQVEGSVVVGGNPQALLFDGTFMYVANADTNTVRRL